MHDNLLKEKVNAKNNIENYIYNCRNAIESSVLREKLGDEKFVQITVVINDTINWLEINKDLELEEYKLYLKSIEEIIQPHFLSVYSKQ